MMVFDSWVNKKPTLPETNIFAPKNGWLEYKPFLCSGALAVRFGEGRESSPPFLPKNQFVAGRP